MRAIPYRSLPDPCLSFTISNGTNDNDNDNDANDNDNDFNLNHNDNNTDSKDNDSDDNSHAPHLAESSSMVRRLAPPQMVECLLEARRRLGSTAASRPTSRYMYSCLNSQGYRLGGNDV